MVISMPLYIQLGKSKDCKKYHINLNNYHNLHYAPRNNLKKAYALIVKQRIGECLESKYSKIALVLTMYRGDKKRVDRSNVLCLHEKFFCDAFVELGWIDDDNDKFIVETIYRTGQIDKENPRVDIEVLPVQ